MKTYDSALELLDFELKLAVTCFLVLERLGPCLLFLLQLSYASLKLSDLGYLRGILLLGGRFSILCALFLSRQRLVLLFKLLYFRLHLLLVLLSHPKLQLRMTVCRLLLFKSLVFFFELPDLVFHLSHFLGCGLFLGLGLLVLFSCFRSLTLYQSLLLFLKIRNTSL